MPDKLETLIGIGLGIFGAIALAELLSKKRCYFCGNYNLKSNQLCNYCGRRI